jgi:hypothetical protein
MFGTIGTVEVQMSEKVPVPLVPTGIPELDEVQRIVISASASLRKLNQHNYFEAGRYVYQIEKAFLTMTELLLKAKTEQAATLQHCNDVVLECVKRIPKKSVSFAVPLVQETLHCPKCDSTDISVPVVNNHCLSCGEYFGTNGTGK